MQRIQVPRLPFPEVAERVARDPSLPEKWAAEARAQEIARFEAFEQRERARLPEHLQACGVLARDADTVAVGPVRTKALELAEEFDRSSKTFLALLGYKGTGKTVAAASLFSGLKRRVPWSSERDAWVWDSTRGRYELADDLARLGYYGSAPAQLERLTAIDLLVIDELGVETESGPWLSTLNALLNKRYGNRRKTALVSNLDWAAFEKRYGARIADRIWQDGIRYVFGPGEQVRRQDR